MVPEVDVKAVAPEDDGLEVVALSVDAKAAVLATVAEAAIPHAVTLWGTDFPSVPVLIIEADVPQVVTIFEVVEEIAGFPEVDVEGAVPGVAFKVAIPGVRLLTNITLEVIPNEVAVEADVVEVPVAAGSTTRRPRWSSVTKSRKYFMFTFGTLFEPCRSTNKYSKIKLKQNDARND